MSKKQKRQVSRSVAPVVNEPVSNNGNGATPVTPAARSYTGRSSIVEFKPDYSYVISDLKRIATLAGSFIFILVVLSFFLR